ncbi:MAG: twin-arginine translocase TatA/TatE family subunit [Deltaproteobacteria bacterium]
MFGVSFPEFLVLGTVALLVLGPDKLPGMLRTLGQWLAKLRKLTTEVRHQSGIDDVLRAEGLDGGLSELRGLMRGGLSGSVLSHAASAVQPSNSHLANRTNLDHFIPDKSREYPPEGADAYGALPEDLLPAAAPAVGQAPPPAGAPEAAPVAAEAAASSADAPGDS